MPKLHGLTLRGQGCGKQANADLSFGMDGGASEAIITANYHMRLVGTLC